MGKFKDITGQKFGKLTALRRANVSKGGHYNWWCVCDCNPDKEILVNGKYLRNGGTKSCGCLCSETRIGRKMKKRSSRFKDLTGQRFGKLTVISCAEKDKHGKYHWWCICDCTPDKLVKIAGSGLKNGTTISCGCYRRGRLGNANRTHGMSNTRIYRIWREMKGRCNNPNIPNYKYYGGKGVQVCERWKKFENFKEDMYESYLEHVAEYGEKDTTLDRIDSNGDYCKENCRWATIKEQANNSSNCVRLTYNNETHTLSEWSDILGIKWHTIELRYRKGYSIDDIFTTYHLQRPEKSIVNTELNYEK